MWASQLLSMLSQISMASGLIEAFRRCDYRGLIQGQLVIKFFLGGGTRHSATIANFCKKKIAETLTQGSALVMDEENKE